MMSDTSVEYWNKQERRAPYHPLVRAYVEPKLTYIQKYVNLGGNILDVGAGDGHFSYYLNKIARTCAVDNSESMLRNNPVHGMKMDANDLRFKSNTFPTVFCHALLHHVEDPVRVVKEMARVSSRNVILIEPNRNNPLMFTFGLLKREERGLLKFSKRYLESIATQTGLEIVHSCSFGSLLRNYMPSFMSHFTLLERPIPLGFSNILICKIRDIFPIPNYE